MVFIKNTSATGIDIRNNVFYVARAGSGDKHCLRFNTAGSTITSDYNVLYMGAASGNVGRITTANYSTLIAWQGTTSLYDLTSSDTDPAFAYATPDDFTPTNTLIDNMCLPVGSVSADINNKIRSTVSPDPGAFENSSFPLSIKLASIVAEKYRSK